MYTEKYPRWFTDNALGLHGLSLSETTSRIFPVYTGYSYLGYNLYIHTSSYHTPTHRVGAMTGALKWESLNVEECGHEIINEFHWSQQSRGTQAIIIATKDRTSYVAVTYERSVSTAGSDAIPRLVQLLCGSTITRSVRDEELATWEETRGCAKGI